MSGPSPADASAHYLIDAVTDYAIYMLDAHGRVASWNTGARRLKGYDEGEVRGRPYEIFFTPEDRANGLPQRILTIAAEEGRVEHEGWRVRRDGGRFWALAVLTAIRGPGGELMGFAKVTRDMTERREAQLQLQRAQAQLAQAQKLEALGKLTGGVAHDFNNLLMVVGGQAQLLRRKVAQDARALRALDAIETATRRGADLTSRLLSFARRQRLSPTPTSLAVRAKALSALLNSTLPASVRLELDFSKELWDVAADPGELDLALLNLAVNARDAMPRGGRLRVTAQNRSLDHDADVGDLRGPFVAISVADDGDGIPADILPKVFDPFFTTKEVGRGSGLGLSQVYGFAQQSGGTVTVDSELGRGAVFTLYLPRAQAETTGDAAAGRPSQGPSARVLLVEDNPDVAEVAAHMLEELGHEVRGVSSGEAGLKALADGPPVDLVFSDIVMAGPVDGLEMARRIRAMAPRTPVLLATGYSAAAERIGAEFPILRKPYGLDELNRAIAGLLVSPT